MEELMKVVRSWVRMVAEGLCTEDEASGKIEEAIMVTFVKGEFK